MELFFIRHAQSENNALWSATRSNDGRVADPELTAVGREQAALLADHLDQPYDPPATDQPFDIQNCRGYGLTHVYCSLMVRAIHTGQAVSQRLGLPLQGWTDIHERGGIYLEDMATGEKVPGPGNTRAYLQGRFPELQWPEDANPDGWWESRPYEDEAQALERARRFWQTLLARHGDSNDRVAIISHGGFFQSCLQALLNLPHPLTHWEPPRYANFAINNCAITRFMTWEAQLGLAYLNRVSFLPASLIT